MKNLKKVLAFVMVFTMILSTIASMTVFGAFADVADTEYEEAVTTLVPLGVIAGYDDGTFKPENTVTRAEMAAFIVRELGLGNSAVAAQGSTKYTDVAADHWASGSINIATNKGIIVGYGNNVFGPEDPVTFEQAVKMVVAALGYEPKAQKNGGYPEGYLIEASALKLTSGMSIAGTDPAKRGVVAQLLYNALDVPLMGPLVYGSNGAVEYGTLYDTNGYAQTILKDALEVTKKYGTIVATETASIVGNRANVGEVRAQDENGVTQTFKVGNTAPSPLLGERVIYYYKYNKSTNTTTLLSVVKDSGKTETLLIDASDLADSQILSASNVDLVYYWEDKDNDTEPVTAKIEGIGTSKLKVMSNNKAVDGTLFDISQVVIPNGTVKLVDTDGNGWYDTVVLSSFRNYIVSEVNSKNKITFTDGSSLTLDADKSTNIRFSIKDTEGEAVEVADLEEDDVLSIFADATDAISNSAYLSSSTLFDIIVCKDTVEGTVTEKGTSKVSIDDTKYKLAEELSINDIELGAEGVFFLDYTGRIADFDADAPIGDYAFLYDAFGENARTIIIDVLTSAGEDIEYKLTGKITVRGAGAGEYDLAVSSEKTALETLLVNAAEKTVTLKNSGAQVVGSLVSLVVSDSKVKEITIPEAPVSTDKDGFKLWYAPDANNGPLTYSSASSMLGNYVLDSSTVVFRIPQQAAAKLDVDDIEVGGKDLLSNSKKYETIVYDKDKVNQAKVLVVVSPDGATDVDAPIAIVKSVSSTKNSDGSKVDRVYFIQSGKEISKLTEAERTLRADSSKDSVYGAAVNKITYDLYPGQVMILDTNSKDEITKSTTRIYPVVSLDPADKTVTNPSLTSYYKEQFFQAWNNSPKNKNDDADLHIIFGEVSDKLTRTSILNIATTDPSQAVGGVYPDATVAVRYNVSGYNVVVIDTTKSDTAVRTGDIGDVEVGDLVLVRKDSGTLKDIVVYKTFNPAKYLGSN